MDRRRTEGEVRAVVAGGPGTLGEERDAERVLGRALTGDPRSLDTGRDIDPGRGDAAEGPGDAGRGQATGQGDRQLPGDRRGQALGGARPGPARVRPAGRVEVDPLGARVEIGPAARDELRGGRCRVRRLRGRAGGGPSRSAGRSPERSRSARSR